MDALCGEGVGLFLRVWIFGLIGCWFVAEKVYSASRDQGPGVGMGLLAAVCFQLCVLGLDPLPWLSRA